MLCTLNLTIVTLQCPLAINNVLITQCVLGPVLRSTWAKGHMWSLQWSEGLPRLCKWCVFNSLACCEKSHWNVPLWCEAEYWPHLWDCGLSMIFGSGSALFIWILLKVKRALKIQFCTLDLNMAVYSVHDCAVFVWACVHESVSLALCACLGNYGIGVP